MDEDVARGSHNQLLLRLNPALLQLHVRRHQGVGIKAAWAQAMLASPHILSRHTQLPSTPREPTISDTVPILVLATQAACPACRLHVAVGGLVVWYRHTHLQHPPDNGGPPSFCAGIKGPGRHCSGC
jgi:hypothetical protein